MSLDKHFVKSSPTHGDPDDGLGCIVKCVGSAWSNDHGSYRKKGYLEIEGNSKKKAIYERDFTQRENAERLPRRKREKPLGAPSNLPPTVLPADPRKDSSAWAFVDDNYKKGYLPFNHNYHHMLPWDVLRGTLAFREAEALQLATYNINEGRNLIILPEIETYATALGLWTHPDDHEGYTEDLKELLNEIKPIVNGKRGHKITQKNAKKYKQLFEDWEDEEFFAIAEAGEEHTEEYLAESIEDYTPSSMTSHANNNK